VGKTIVLAVFIVMFALLAARFFSGERLSADRAPVDADAVKCVIEKYKNYRAPAELFERKPEKQIVLYRKRMYTVEEGDTLSSISAKFYGTTGRWEKILKANRDNLSGAGMLRAGMKIVVPDDPSPLDKNNR
jgi:nucleoid-associated protein YgaU